MKTKELLEDYFHLFCVFKATEHYNGTFTTYMIWTTNKPDLDGIRGIRNRIVHDYTGINSFRIFEIIKNNVPVLKQQVHEIMSIYIKSGIIDKEEYTIARESEFYKHINFEL